MPASKLLFGWCFPSSKDHASCKTEFTFEGKQIVCQCECHTKKASKK